MNPSLLKQQLQEALSAESVSELAGRLGRSTGFEATKAALVVKPQSTAEVQRVVRIASAHGARLYPISRGNNWGYGDATASVDGCVIVDLSRMNRIIEVDSELGYAVVEPGVSQGQLYEHLEAHGLPLWMDVLGSGPDASIVGNIMERGFGLGPQSDRAANACGMEVVLADGSLLRTGLGAYPDSKARHCFRNGPGPQLDGIFTQANLGIVTRLTFWLMPKPETFRAFFIRLDRDETIGKLLEALRPLRMMGTIRCSTHCYNGMRLLGALTRFPYHRVDGREALELAHPEITAQMLREHGVPRWLAGGSLFGTRKEVRAAAAALKRAVRKVPGAKLDLLDRRSTPFLRKAASVGRRIPKLGRFGKQAAKLAMWVDFLQGKTSYQTLVGSHWRARREAGHDEDPRDSGSGMIWVSPLLPAREADVQALQTIARSTFHEFGFEYQVTISQVSDRALCAVTSIHFDRDSVEETRRARACHDVLVDRLIASGFIPYRGHPLTIARLRDDAPAYWHFASRLKEALDPQQLIAPGRYIPGPSSVDNTRAEEPSSRSGRPAETTRAFASAAGVGPRLVTG